MLLWSGGMVELANAFVICPGDPGLNLGVDKNYFLILFVLHLNSNLKGVISGALIVNTQYVWDEEPFQNVILNFKLFHKVRHTAKSITLNNSFVMTCL
jgi:hypothetical protein